MVNIWNAYQCMVTFNLSRSASFYESGIGRGMGFRDSSQDLLGFVHMVPARARQRMVDIASTQLPSGGAYHQYQPLTKRGNDDVGSGFNDDPLWLVLAVCAYLKETGRQLDIAREGALRQRRRERGAVLRPPAPLHRLHPRAPRAPTGSRSSVGRTGTTASTSTVSSSTPGESFQITENRSGSSAESVFIAGLFCLAAKEMAAWLESGAGAGWAEPCEADRYRQAAASMEATIGAHGWDGQWFRRAYDYFGAPVGSGANQEGQIFIEPQGMCVMGGAGASDGRARQALDSVRARLATPHGIVLNRPSYSRYYLELGEISSYPPGLQGKRQRLLPHQPVGNDRRGNVGGRGRRLRLLQAHQPVGPGGHQRGPPGRALRVRANHRRPRCRHLRARPRTHG